MELSIILAAATAVATATGGAIALRSRDRLHLVLGLSAGLLLGLVAFDLLPEVFEMSSTNFLGAPAVSVAIVGGFLLLHVYERFFGSHEPAESDYGHDHKHSANLAGSVGALAMGIHVFLDGLALGVAFVIDEKLGIAVFVALLVHAFSDGLNTVSLLIKSGKWSRKAIWLLGVDSVARISGAAIGASLTVSSNLTAIYLAAFSGILIYLATSHILPEAHARHESRWTLISTLAGVAIMWALVSQLEAVHVHAHGDDVEHSTTHEEEGKHDEDAHEADVHKEGEHSDEEDHDHAE
ncbi:MAG: ZIP family metal transporter [Candidatus Nanopelagicus sp.]